MDRAKEVQQHFYSKASTRAIEQAAISRLAQGELVLMQRAAQALLALIKQRWPSRKRLLIYAGVGNNGGDGYLLGAYASAEGFQVSIKVVGQKTALSQTVALAQSMARQAGLCFTELSTPCATDLVIDALLGIGLSRPVQGELATAIAQINRHACPVLAVDLPSGLCADTGQVLGMAVKADATLSFITHKPGLWTADGPDYAGERLLDTLAIPPELYPLQPALAKPVNGEALLQQVPKRQKNCHKGMAGHVLVVGGDHGMGGAPLLSAEAALRCGAGLVSILTRQAHVSAIIARRPECMVKAVGPRDTIEPLLQQADVIIAGPGLGQAPWGQHLLSQVLAQQKALVLDADALSLLAQQQPERLPEQCILTPHPGEAARLLACSSQQVQQDRIKAVKALQQRFQARVLLKGNGSLLADAKEVQLLTAGNPGMASAGMGDLLCGIIAALWAQGLAATDACALAAWLHASAADQLAKDFGCRGLLATDVLPRVRQLLNQRPGLFE